MIDKLSNQSRIIIATVLSFLFFATYDYYFIPKKEAPVEQQAKTELNKNSSTAAPASANPSLASSKASKDVPVQVVQNSQDIIATIIAGKYEVKIDKLGRISRFYLNEEKYRDEDGERIQLVDSELGPFPLEIRFTDTNINKQAFEVPYVASAEKLKVGKDGVEIILTQSLSGLNIKKTLTFYPKGNYDIHLELDKQQEYFITPGFRPNTAVDMYTFHGALIRELDGTREMIGDGDAEGNERFMDATIAAGTDKYYTTAFYNFDTGFNVVVSPVHDNSPLLFVKGSDDLKFSGYIGPKYYNTLAAIDSRLTDIIEYGFMTFMAKPLFILLQTFFSWTGNWGWSIVLMTILIRLVLFPLTYKGMVSMNKLKALSPKIKELQAKHKGDKQKLNTQMMELYKKHGANPMGGCLPILLQIPVFFAIYRVLQNAIELKASPWIFWVEDLSIMDPYFILPVAMGVTMFLHQRITPTNFTDPMQEKIMKFLPVIFTFFFMTFPAGLTLYWFINNLFSMGQQYYVNSLFAKNENTDMLAVNNKKDKK